MFHFILDAGLARGNKRWLGIGCGKINDAFVARLEEIRAAADSTISQPPAAVPEGPSGYHRITLHSRLRPTLMDLTPITCAIARRGSTRYLSFVQYFFETGKGNNKTRGNPIAEFRFLKFEI